MAVHSRITVLVVAAALLGLAAFAPAASAVQLHTSASPTELTGSLVEASVLTIPNAGTIECTGTTETGTVTGTTVSEFETHPSYSGCKAFGYATSHIATQGCNFKVFTIGGSGPTYAASASILCSAGNKIIITPTFFGASICTVTIEGHTPSGGVDLINENFPNWVKVRYTMTGISHSAGCGALAAADGTYVAGSRLSGPNRTIWVQ